MISLKFFVLLILLAGFFAGCSVYKSTGRKSFESRAPGNIQHIQVSKDLCWSQPATEALWEVQNNETLTVTKLDDDQIQVCTQDNGEHHATH